MPVNLNTSIFQGLRGILRITTLVVGIIDLSITADNYAAIFGKEQFYLAIVIIAFLLSLVWTILLLLGVLGEDKANLVKNIDSIGHMVIGILLLIATICWFISVLQRGDPCGYPTRLRDAQPYAYWHYGPLCSSAIYPLRVIAGILGLVNGVVYIVLGSFVFTGRG